MVDLHKQPGENEEQFIWRLGRAKDSGELDMEWDKIAEIINKEFRAEEDEYRNESAYRKPYQGARRFYEAGCFKDLTSEAYVKIIQEEKRNVQIEKQKLRDEKLEYNAWLREEARDNLIAERICDAIKSIQPLNIPEFEITTSSSNKEAILAFGDEHYGTEFKIFGLHGEIINEYSPEIFEQRMWNLFNQTVEIIKKEGIETLNVFALGDFTDGVLRCSQLRKLRYGVVEGSVRYANFIANWLNELSKYIRIKYQMTYGNHSELRMLGQPKGTFKEENTGLFVREIIHGRLVDNINFEMIENPTGLIYDTIAGINTLGIHGECKNMERAIKDFSATYNTDIKLLIGGHMHHYQGAVVGVDREVINVPSIIGIDDYAMSLNKTSKPGASLMVLEPNDGINVEYKIKL